MKLLFQQLIRLWRELGPGPRIVLVGTAVAVVAGMVAMLTWAHRPQMRLLYGKLGQKEAGEIVTEIQAQGVPFELGGDGTSIYVAADQVYKVRMELASKGLPGGDGVGFEIFDRSNFGISDFIQRTNYMRAIQGELARTIGQLKGVRTARVMVAVPEHRLLLKTDDSRTTASVMVDTGGVILEPGSVNSIRSLVANAIEGLKLNDVAVVDNHGNVLSDEVKDEGLAGGGGGLIKYRKQVEDYLGGKVETMLAKVLGPGQAVARVSAEINTDGTTISEDKYDPESQVARSETNTDESTVSNEKNPQEKATGVSANTPPDPNADKEEGTGRTSQETRKSITHSYELNHQTTSTVKTPGNVTRVTAAVFLAQRTAPRTPDELTALRRMVANALGIVATKPQELENLVSLQETPFPAAVDTTSMAPEKIGGYLEAFRPIIGVGVALIALFIFLRWLKGTKPDEIAWELVKDTASDGLPSAGGAAAIGAGPQIRTQKVSPELLNELIRQKPENVGATLRDWLATKD